AMPNIQKELTFENVAFSYHAEEPVLDNISFTAKKGQTIALVGPTGAGKSTIIHLLTRFYDVTKGAIQIDGVDIRDYDRHSVRQKMGMVLQDTFLFKGSIMENIRYGRLEATDEEVKEAARLANAATFIEKLPKQYDTNLTANGANISQGQRQLLAIARAILVNHNLLILD